MKNTNTATVTNRNFCDINKHPSIQFSLLIDGRSFEPNESISFSFCRLYRKIRQYQLEKQLERLRQELAGEKAARPKPWRPKKTRTRKANYWGRLQKW